MPRRKDGFKFSFLPSLAPFLAPLAVKTPSRLPYKHPLENRERLRPKALHLRCEERAAGRYLLATGMNPLP